jgi:hypothetical protein
LGKTGTAGTGELAGMDIPSVLKPGSEIWIRFSILRAAVAK